MNILKIILAYLASNGPAIAAVSTVALGTQGGQAVQQLTTGLPGVVSAIAVIASIIGQRYLRNAEPAKGK